MNVVCFHSACMSIWLHFFSSRLCQCSAELHSKSSRTWQEEGRRWENTGIYWQTGYTQLVQQYLSPHRKQLHRCQPESKQGCQQHWTLHGCLFAVNRWFGGVGCLGIRSETETRKLYKWKGGEPNKWQIWPEMALSICCLLPVKGWVGLNTISHSLSILFELKIMYVEHLCWFIV